MFAVMYRNKSPCQVFELCCFRKDHLTLVFFLCEKEKMIDNSEGFLKPHLTSCSFTMSGYNKDFSFFVL